MCFQDPFIFVYTTWGRERDGDLGCTPPTTGLCVAVVSVTKVTVTTVLKEMRYYIRMSSLLGAVTVSVDGQQMGMVTIATISIVTISIAIISIATH